MGRAQTLKNFTTKWYKFCKSFFESLKTLKFLFSLKRKIFHTILSMSGSLKCLIECSHWNFDRTPRLRFFALAIDRLLRWLWCKNCGGKWNDPLSEWEPFGDEILFWISVKFFGAFFNYSKTIGFQFSQESRRREICTLSIVKYACNRADINWP